MFLIFLKQPWPLKLLPPVQQYSELFLKFSFDKKLGVSWSLVALNSLDLLSNL